MGETKNLQDVRSDAFVKILKLQLGYGLFALVIVLLLVLDQFDYEQDYE